MKATREETGCLDFSLHLGKETDDIVFYEVFKSDADFEAHCKAVHTKNFLQSLKGKVENDGPQLTFLNRYMD